MDNRASKKISTIQLLIKMALWGIVALTIGLYCYSLVCGHVKGEAYYGNFETFDLNDNWTMKDAADSSEKTISLPLSVSEKVGGRVLLSRTLPDDIEDGMSLCTRASMQDIIIRIDGKERGTYTSAGFEHMNEKLPSSYLVVDLTGADASKLIEIDITSKKQGIGKYNPVTYGFGDNSWFPIIKRNMSIVLISILTIFVGFGALLAYLLMRSRIPDTKSLLFLSGMMIVNGMWILSESELRQLIFEAPSYSSIYSYILVSIISALTVLYFNDVQNGMYHKWYYTICGIIVCQVIINTVLHFTGIVQYYDTLTISHFWTVIAILISVTTIVIDFRKKRIQNYSIIALGILGIVVCAVIEMLMFYFASIYKLGAYLGVGLVILMVATFSQIFIDAVANAERRRIDAERRIESTINTITKTIDAKDQYTGGHSERVGQYARTLCEAVADKYGFTSEDFSNVQYIGNLHDIGKIGVPDAVLNKQGKLDDDEFKLLKSHTTIGAKILEKMDTVEGLREGVLYHHERYDGKGYPEGLKGEEIPIYARILCLADSYDAMTTDRVYRTRLSDEEVKAEIKRNSGIQLDPYLSEVVIELIDKKNKNKES